MKIIKSLKLYMPLYFVIMMALAACGSSTTIPVTYSQPTSTVNPASQSQISPLPTIPPYRCGAWASNNAPSPADTITIYSRLTHENLGVPGITASAVVHFKSSDVHLGSTVSDAGGYVTFTLALADQQPAQVPATVEITFTGTQNGSLACTAFFTPH